MQRKGVPAIDGCLCEIKEKLKALYDRTHACILRINGKTPDGNGDITLDLSDAIPGRYVESVNGQDGNVIIDKASVGLSNVDNVSSSQILNQADANNQSRLEAFEAAKLDPVELEVVANSGRIIQLEGQQVVLDDKMEQTIQYVDAIGDDVAEIEDAYVDKTTTQYITGKKYVPTAGADDYEGMIANVDYLSRTDPATRQNNLVHLIGDEHIEGTKYFDKVIRTTTRPVFSLTNSNLDSSSWVKVYSWTASTTQRMLWVDMFDRLNGRTARYLLSGAVVNGTIRRDMGTSTLDAQIKLAYANGIITFFTNKRRATFNVVMNAIGSSLEQFDITIENMQNAVDEPTTANYTWVVGVTE